jgi:proline iminopeptidase
MPEAAVNGTTLYYTEAGAGPPCLMLHGGLGFDHTYLLRSFGPLETSLRMLFFDMRGNGRSGRPPLESLTMEQLADDASALLDHLGVESAIVFGHSYGGFVAQELALRHPGRVRALILAGTTPGQLGATEDPSDEQGEPPPPELQALMAAQPATDEEFAAMMPDVLRFYLHRLQPAAVVPHMADTIYSAAAMSRSMQVLGGWSSVDRLGQVSAPTLIMAGAHDVITSPPQANRIAKRIPGAEVRMFDESGHFPWFEEPEAFFASMRDWLRRHGELE